MSSIHHLTIRSHFDLVYSCWRASLFLFDDDDDDDAVLDETDDKTAPPAAPPTGTAAVPPATGLTGLGVVPLRPAKLAPCEVVETVAQLTQPPSVPPLLPSTTGVDRLPP